MRSDFIKGGPLRTFRRSFNANASISSSERQQIGVLVGEEGKREGEMREGDPNEAAVPVFSCLCWSRLCGGLIWISLASPFWFVLRLGFMCFSLCVDRAWTRSLKLFRTAFIFFYLLHKLMFCFWTVVMVTAWKKNRLPCHYGDGFHEASMQSADTSVQVNRACSSYTSGLFRLYCNKIRCTFMCWLQDLKAVKPFKELTNTWLYELSGESELCGLKYRMRWVWENPQSLKKCFAHLKWRDSSADFGPRDVCPNAVRTLLSIRSFAVWTKLCSFLILLMFLEPWFSKMTWQVFCITATSTWAWESTHPAIKLPLQ